MIDTVVIEKEAEYMVLVRFFFVRSMYNGLSENECFFWRYILGLVVGNLN